MHFDGDCGAFFALSRMLSLHRFIYMWFVALFLSPSRSIWEYFLFGTFLCLQLNYCSSRKNHNPTEIAHKSHSYIFFFLIICLLYDNLHVAQYAICRLPQKRVTTFQMCCVCVDAGSPSAMPFICLAVFFSSYSFIAVIFATKHNF